MENALAELVTQLKALADPVRLRLLALCAEGECSVSELTRVTGQSQPRVSQHLKKLCDAGLLERFRDGHFVYYQLPRAAASRALHRRLLDLIPVETPRIRADRERLRGLRSETTPRDAHAAPSSGDRRLHRALVELTVAKPLGDLVDIGCGQGRILKLLASRAHRAIGVDIDADARQLARAELLLAGATNCSLRQGDMYALPFADHEFDTVVLDDVLGDAERPADALGEARRLLKPGGRLLILAACSGTAPDQLGARLAAWCRSVSLRLAAPRAVPVKNPRWLIAVATSAETGSAAA